MRKAIYLSAALIFSVLQCYSQSVPGAEVFRVIKGEELYGPKITAMLRKQTDLAWQQDEVRRENLRNIKTTGDLQALQNATREKLLMMIGGLPTEKTPLRSQLLGKIQMNGFYIEKLVFQSLPGFYVTALVYVPENGAARHPAVLVACGHSPIGKAYYQGLCQRLVKRGYLVICWDPVGQAERSQFWDEKISKSRYNLVCGEHAILGNLAYLSGANLVRWETWDGIRAVDYLLTRQDVDKERISITGTSGGGLQAAYIGALDERIKVVVPSCYISSLPMRAYNRIFADPDSDPEQDPVGMISEGVDHTGLLLLIYPRPLMIAAAVLDFFPIEGARSTFREIADLYRRFEIENRVAMVEGYHKHQFSLENQDAALAFLDRFNNMPDKEGLPSVEELKQRDLQCTKAGQVLLEYPDAKNLTDLIKDYFHNQQNRNVSRVATLYYGKGYPNIKNWTVSEYSSQPQSNNISWQKTGHYEFDEVQIDQFVLHHSNGLHIPLLYFYSAKNPRERVLMLTDLYGKADQKTWPEVSKRVKNGENVISFDFRGTGEDKMNFEATSSEYLTFAVMDSTQRYFNPVSGVFANYVYNSLLTGRPYFLQMIEDVEIVNLFLRSHLKVKEINLSATADAKPVAREIFEIFPDVKAGSKEELNGVNWSDIINDKRELWPIHNLLPGGAFIR